MTKPGSIAAAALLTSLLAAALPAAWGDRLAPSKQDSPPETYIGEAVVRAEEGLIVVSLDEAGASGKADGRVDHIFSLRSLPPIVEPLALWDPEAEVEVRADGLRVVLHQSGQVLDFWLSGFELGRRGKKHPSYVSRSFIDTIQLYRYSGAAVDRFLLMDTERASLDELTSSAKSSVSPFLPDPDPDAGSGGSCSASCTKSCAGGACSAVCNPGFCAKCTCTGDPAVLPSCYCELKK